MRLNERQITRRERERERQRQEMLDTAMDLFAGKGYHNVTMREIAEKADFAIGTLYKFFRNKEDLYKALMLQRVDEFNEAIRKALDGPEDVMDKLRGYVKTKGELFQAHLPAIRLYFMEAHGESFDLMAGLDSEIRKRRRKTQAILESVFASGTGTGRFKAIADPHALALALDGITTAFLFEWLEDPERYPYPEDPDVILNILCKGLVDVR
ncbi:MAG TPA: TetR/AcrR family transcriptional regulator [Deltaproteobacteria bacterium]|nr:TetR/AcrR family transcriptional regulator [Deltaproteobacteria bacterium]